MLTSKVSIHKLPRTFKTSAAALAHKKFNMVASKAFNHIPAFSAPRTAMLVNCVPSAICSAAWVNQNFFYPSIADSISVDLAFSHMGIRRRFIKFFRNMGVKVEEIPFAYGSLYANTVGIRLHFTAATTVKLSDFPDSAAADEISGALNTMLIEYFVDALTHFIRSEIGDKILDYTLGEYIETAAHWCFGDTEETPLTDRQKALLQDVVGLEV